MEFNGTSQKSNLGKCNWPDFYYEVFKINVITSGYYVFSAESSIRPIGTLYNTYFNPYNPLQNQLSRGALLCNIVNTTYLLSNTTYVLVVSSYFPNMKGTFSMVIHGSAAINLSRIGTYMNTFRNETLVSMSTHLLSIFR